MFYDSGLGQPTFGSLAGQLLECIVVEKVTVCELGALKEFCGGTIHVFDHFHDAHVAILADIVSYMLTPIITIPTEVWVRGLAMIDDMTRVGVRVCVARRRQPLIYTGTGETLAPTYSVDSRRPSRVQLSYRTNTHSSQSPGPAGAEPA